MTANPKGISPHFPGREIPSWLTVELALSALEMLKLSRFLAGRPAKWLEFPLGLPSKDPTSETFRVKLFTLDLSDYACFESPPTQISGQFLPDTSSPKPGRLGTWRIKMTTFRDSRRRRKIARKKVAPAPWTFGIQAKQLLSLLIRFV